VRTVTCTGPRVLPASDAANALEVRRSTAFSVHWIPPRHSLYTGYDHGILCTLDTTAVFSVTWIPPRHSLYTGYHHGFLCNLDTTTVFYANWIPQIPAGASHHPSHRAFDFPVVIPWLFVDPSPVAELWSLDINLKSTAGAGRTMGPLLVACAWTAPLNNSIESHAVQHTQPQAHLPQGRRTPATRLSHIHTRTRSSRLFMTKDHSASCPLSA